MQQLNNFEKYMDFVINHNVIYITSVDGIITFANDKLCEISGFSNSDLIGEKYNFLFHPNESKESYIDLLTTINDKKVFKSTVENLSKNGDSFWLKQSVTGLIKDNEIVEYIHICEDITDEVIEQQKSNSINDQKLLSDLRKATSIQNKNLVESIPLPSFIIDDKIIVSKNSLFEEVFLLTLMNEDEIVDSILDTSYSEYILNVSSASCVLNQLEINDQVYSIKAKRLEDNKILILLISI